MTEPMHPPTRTGAHPAIVAPLALLLLALASVGAATIVPAPPGPPNPIREAFLGRRPILGFAINAHHISDLPAYLESVDEIAKLGANTLVLVTPMFQDTVASNEIRYLKHRCPTDDQLFAILHRAHQHGLSTMLLPIVLIENPVDKDWRGVIEPTDWDAWWSSYDRFLDRYIDLALRAEVDVLSIGSELNSTEPQVDRWKRLAERTRSRFPGVVTYSSNWDRYNQVSFWSLFDVICVSSYFEVGRNAPDAPSAFLAMNWAKERDRMATFARRHDRPILISEIGYPSLVRAAKHPWNYVPLPGERADHEAQARCYRALFMAWRDAVTTPGGPLLGFCCYHWDPYRRGGEWDTGYGIRGKPSYEVIRDGFAAIRKRAAERLPQPAGPTSRPTSQPTSRPAAD